MQVVLFHLMPYAELDLDAGRRNGTVWVRLPNRHFDPEKGHKLYNRYLDELEYGEQLGFDALGVNEHHQTATNLNPSAAVVMGALGRVTRTARILILEMLTDGPVAVSRLRDDTGLEASNLSQHLGILRRQHLIIPSRKDGRLFYELSCSDVKGVLEAAGGLLTTGTLTIEGVPDTSIEPLYPAFIAALRGQFGGHQVMGARLRVEAGVDVDHVERARRARRLGEIRAVGSGLGRLGERLGRLGDFADADGHLLDGRGGLFDELRQFVGVFRDVVDRGRHLHHRRRGRL